MSKTIKQIADELGVSKQAVHQKRKKEPLSTALRPFTSTVDGVVYISVDGEKLIKSAFEADDRKRVDVNVDGPVYTPVDGPVDGENNVLYQILRDELAAKNRLIEQLQAELAAERAHNRAQADEIAKLADQAQKLHAGTLQQQQLSLPAEADTQKKKKHWWPFGSKE